MKKQITAGRRQVVFLGNTGPNNAREWVVIQYRNGPNGDGESVMRVSTRLGIEPPPNLQVQWTDKKYLYQYLKNMRHKLSRPGVILMNKLATAATAATQFSPYGSGGGRYFGRRAADSRVVPMKPAEAEKVADRPAAKSAADAPTDWLAVWWVPPEYGNEGPGRIKSGWIKPLWDWGRGRLVKKGADVVKASKQVVAVDRAMVDELKMFIENDAQLYRQRTRPVQVNLEKKWQKGTYNHAQAPKLWMYLVNDGAKQYIKQYATPDMKIDVATRKQVAQELADEWQDEMEAQFGPMGASASTRVQAGTWQEQAKAELEAELGGIETDYTPNKGRDYFSLETMSGRADNGESEWVVFKDSKSAERYAIEYVTEMLNDDPSMFDQKWLKRHVFVTPNDIKMIASEDADSYVDDIKYESDERLLDEAGMLRQWQSMEDKKDALSDKMMAEMDPKKQAAMQKQIDKLDDMQSAVVDKADSKLRAELAKRTADALKKDPLAWAEELGFSFDKDRPAWLKIDVRKAAQDAVNTDGVAHFLDAYDSEAVDLDSGAVAFGTN